MKESHARPGYKRRHRSLVDDVAAHANIRRDVVEDVLNGFYDIMAERLLNEREFLLKDLISIHAVRTKNGIRPEPHLQFRAKISQGLRKLLQRTEEDPSLEVTRESWRDQIKALKAGSKNGPKSMELSDFLRDDDEE